MAAQPGFFDMERRYKKLEQTRDFLKRINAIVDWEAFRPTLDAALKRSDRKAGGLVDNEHRLGNAMMRAIQQRTGRSAER
jgi:hypothetical protein